MSDIFGTKDVQKLLANKHIIFFGDSNVRALYKDLVWLLSENTLITCTALKKKLENSFKGDTLKQGSHIHRGRDFEEIREYKSNDLHIEFYFLTRCYTSLIENIMTAIKEKRKPAPQLIIMNSCLWDICRWGPNGVTAYKDNLIKLMRLLKASLPAETLVIWTTALPVSTSCRGGFLVKQIEFLHHTLRFEVMEANMFARQIVPTHGFDVLDIHHHLRMQIHRRAEDGIHWFPTPVRHMTNLILTHIALSWDCQLPGNFQSPVLEKLKLQKEDECKQEIVFPSIPAALLEENKLAENSTTNSKKEKPTSGILTSKNKKSRGGKNKKKNDNSTSETHPEHAAQTPSSDTLHYEDFHTDFIPQMWEKTLGEWGLPQMNIYNIVNGPMRQRNMMRRDRRYMPYFF